MHFNKMWIKRKFSKEERKGIKVNTLDHSLSLKHFKRNISKQILMLLPFCPVSSKKCFDKVWTLNKMAISNSKKNPNRHILAFERNSSKMISNLQRNHMGSFTIKLGSQPYIFWWGCKMFKCWNIWNTKWYLNRNKFFFIPNGHKIFSKL